ncbi:polysaccharide deacetylase family protein [Mesorhizobium sp. IMUNJ 23232]|uniref:polysaccharide deacetylase family protein n=1 Tax=Mesorhizobium sp. IMUNJ 23232 TaxID=3376064 RepID=UPI0037BA08D5
MPILSRLLVAAAIIVGASTTADAGTLLEPSLHLKRSTTAGETRVALTLDACGGRADNRILSALVDNNIPATIFVTGLWLKRNKVAFAIMRAHPDLFEIEDHGARHVPAVETPVRVYGIRAAGSLEAVDAEVKDGAAAIEKAGGDAPRWFRGATAKYSTTSMKEIQGLGFRVAGYSINADGGSLLPAAATEKRVAAAKDGDVIIAHINQPSHSAGAGLVKGLLALKARGVTFVRLQDADETGS